MVDKWKDDGFTLATVDGGTHRGDANAILVDPLFKEAKNNNKDSAIKLWQQEWDRGAAENETRLKLALEKGKVPVFISVPGTSRKNQIPPTAAAFLAEKSGEDSRFINGDKYFLPIHTSMMKSIPKGERLFHPRVYEARHNVFKAIQEAVPNAQFFIVEDLLTTGNSAHSFQRFLEKNGFNVRGVIAMKGEYEPAVPPKLVKRIDKFFKENNIQVDAGKLCVEITGKEAQTLAFQTVAEYQKADPVHQQLFRDLFETLYEIKVNDNHRLLIKMDQLGSQLADYLHNSNKQPNTNKGKEDKNEKRVYTQDATSMPKISLSECLKENSGGKIGRVNSERATQDGADVTKAELRCDEDISEPTRDYSDSEKNRKGSISSQLLKKIVADKIKS